MPTLHPAIWAAAIVAGLLILFAVTAPRLLRVMQKREAARAIRDFRLRREQLEAKFLELASAREKPRGLKWLSCDWHPSVTFGRGIESGLLTAFVAVSVRFEVAEGTDPDEFPLAGLEREAVAVFYFRDGRWGTGGRVLFNMSPEDAVQRLADEFAPLSAPTAKSV